MSSASDARRRAPRPGHLTIPLGTELAVLALPALLLVLVAAGPVEEQAHATPAAGAPPNVHALRVCADPNNLPFSNEKQQGFENRIASLIAKDLGVPVQYTWWPERRGFVRNTLKAKRCDVVMEVPASYELTERTAPYYRSTYVFVTRADRHLTIRSFDDPALRHLRIGIHMMGDDYANSPAAVALARRGLAAQIVPYMIYGDYSQPDPPARLIRAVAEDSVDVAVAWGPLAGYFAKKSPVRLTLTPVTPASGGRFPAHALTGEGDEGFAFSMAMGVRHGDSVWRAILDSELTRRRGDIRRILEEYGVPLVDTAAR
jgi:quinoprotein dehydrogenase-associated probable ABC transporter substrate-binding protein